MAVFGNFPGVRVTTQSGGISGVTIGEEEKLVLFGEPRYDVNSNGEVVVDGDDVALTPSVGEPVQIRARREADGRFGQGSPLTGAMKDAIANGADIGLLFAVAVPRTVIVGEVQTTQTGTLGESKDSLELVENTGVPAAPSTGDANDFGISAEDDDGALEVELRYSPAPSIPSESKTVHVNPLTGEYAVSDDLLGDPVFDYTRNEYGDAFSRKAVVNVVDENETGIFATLSESDAAAAKLDGQVASLREDFQMVNAVSSAEPNASEVLVDAETSDENGGADARFDAANYGTANQGVSSERFYKFAPTRLKDEERKLMGGVGGLFAGNAIENPIYNDELTGFQQLEQKLTRTEADNLRDNDVIPVRSGPSVRVVGNRSTNFSSSDTVAASFFTRRVTDRVILIAKTVGDEILGQVNDEDTRSTAEGLIISQLRQLVSDGLIRPNTGSETNFSVDVFESSTDNNKVNIDVSFTPFGVVKRVDETITVDV
jgi:hypothetical protein